MERRIKLEKNRLRAAIAVCVYFCFILTVYYLKLEFQFFRVIGELLTISALLALVFIPVWALIDSFRKKNKKQSTYILTLLASLITMVLLLLANFFSS